MHVLMAGPCEVGELKDHVEVGRDALPTGMPGNSVLALTKELLTQGHDITLVTLDPHVTEEVTAEGQHLRIIVGPYRHRRRARDFFRAEREFVTRAIAQQRPMVVHAHWTYEYALGALATRHPTLVTVRDWGPAILRFHKHPYRAVRLLMQLETFRRKPPLTVVSPYMKARVERLVRYDVDLVPNGVHDELFAERSGVSRTEDQPPTIVSVNHGFDVRKNVKTLLQAFSTVHHEMPEVRLALIGHGFGRGQQAHAWATEHGLTGNVEFVGRLPQAAVVERLRGATMLVHPSLEESFGLVLVEAMAQHTPVLAGAASGGVPWVLDHGLAGALCDVRRPPRLAKALLELLRDAPARKELSRRGYARADANFRMSTVASQFVGLYEKLAS